MLSALVTMFIVSLSALTAPTGVAVELLKKQST